MNGAWMKAAAPCNDESPPPVVGGELYVVAYLARRVRSAIVSAETATMRAAMEITPVMSSICVPSL